MEMKITKTEKQPALRRAMLVGEIHYEGPTPARKDIKGEMAKHAKQPAERVIIRHIESKFGQHNAVITAYAYEDTETMNSLESKRTKERNAPKKKAEGEAPAEA
jgi:small subunit ribosomal protein S24e